MTINTPPNPNASDIINESTDDQLGDQPESLGACPLPACTGVIQETPKAYSCSLWSETSCNAVIWKEMSGKAVTKDMAITLLETGKTDLIRGFKSKSGATFDAVLVLESGRVQFSFGEPLGSCPLCTTGQINETPQAYGCSEWRDSGCPMTIWKTIAKRPITRDEADHLLKHGETPVLDGFTSRAGQSFNAKLVLQGGKATFSFD